jgi:sporulation protein YlmC with PRC-barrel domain
MNLVKPLVLSFSLIAFAGAYADEAKKDRSDAQAKPSMSQTDSAAASARAGATAGGMSARKLIDMDVVDSKGEALGEIGDVVLDLHNARVHAAVLESGGFLGLGEKHYAFPISEFKPAKDKDKLALNVDKEKLKAQKGFEKGKWPAMGDEYWGRIGTKDKAAAGATQPAQKKNLVRASELMGRDVTDKSGKEIGEIKDVILSSDNARIQHLVIDVKGAGQAQVQPKSVSLGTGDKLVLDMSADELKRQAKPEKRAGAGTSTGASAGATAGKSFTALDRDNDGALSQMEAAADADAKSNFEKLDKNKDEKLSRAEWEAGQGAAAGATGKQDEQKGPAKTDQKPVKSK